MTLLQRVRRLPDGFVWGADTAAYQAEGALHEGGKGATMWEDYLAAQGRYSPEAACDFYHRYDEDLSLAAAHGLRAVRLSIAWTRIFPSGTDAEPNAEGVRFYHDLFASCARHGLVPYVTLHHFDTPKPLFDAGDWLNRATTEAFLRYAAFCFREFREVKVWLTINEPVSLAHSQYLQGNFPPGHHFCVGEAVQSLHNMLVAHARAVLLYRRLDAELGLGGRIGHTEIVTPAYPATDAVADCHAADLYNALYTDFALDAALGGAYAPRTMELMDELMAANGATLAVEPGDLEVLAAAAPHNDLFGLNYYQSVFVRAYAGPSANQFNGTGDRGTTYFRFKGVGELVSRPELPTTDWDWVIYPRGLRETLVHIARRYEGVPPIYVTENGMGCKDPAPGPDGIVADPARIDYLDQHVEQVLLAREEGVDVRGYFIWSLQDELSWSNGYDKRYGLFYVDFPTQRRFVKLSALWSRELAAASRVDGGVDRSAPAGVHAERVDCLASTGELAAREGEV